ncbi:MAG: hypothetical protein R3E02_11795 [Blastomonas sp.]
MANENTVDIVSDAELLLHRYDETNDNYQFVQVSRDVHRASTFLTDQHLPKDLASVVLRRIDTIRDIPTGAPVHFIFHSAYCCSTMLARAFDIEGISMGLKEPVVLNDMVGWKRRGSDPKKLAEVLDQSMRWLSKPFTRGESIIIKPSNIVNILAMGILALRPNAKAVLLHAPLRTYLQSIAKKNLWGRLWVRTLLIGQIKDRMIEPFGMTNDDLLALSDLQVAAIGWLAQHSLFNMTIARMGGDRVKSLNSENFLANKRETMTRLRELYELDIPDHRLDEVLGGPAFVTHSKTGADFGSQEREREHIDAAKLHIDEIEKVEAWALSTAERMRIPITLGSPLF